MPDEKTLYRSWDRDNRAFLEVLNPLWWRETLESGPPPRNDVEYERNRAMERLATLLDRITLAQRGELDESVLLEDLGDVDAWAAEAQAELRQSPSASPEAGKFLADLREMLRATAQLIHEKKGVGLLLADLARELYLAGSEASKELSASMQEQQRPSYFSRWGTRGAGGRGFRNRERARSASERALSVFRTLWGSSAGREVASNVAALLRMLLYQAGDYAETAVKTGSMPSLMGGGAGAGAAATGGAGGLTMGAAPQQLHQQQQQQQWQQPAQPAFTKQKSGLVLGGSRAAPSPAPQHQPQYFQPHFQQPQQFQQQQMGMGGGISIPIGGVPQSHMQQQQPPQMQQQMQMPGQRGQEAQARVDRLVELSRSILSSASKDPELQGALNELLSLFWEYEGQVQTGLKSAGASRAAQNHRQRAAELADRLLRELTGGHSLQRLSPQMQQFAQIVRNDPNLNQFYQNLRAFINANMQQPDAIPAEAFRQQFWALYQQGQQAFQSVQQQAQPLLQDVSKVYSDMIQTLKNDRAVMRYMEAWQKMGSTFFYRTPSGYPTLNTQALMNVVHSLLPMIANTLKFVALPPLLYEDPSTKLLLDELVIFTPALPPDTLQAHLESFFSFDFERLSYAREHGVLTVYLRNIKVIAPNFRFGIRRKTGLAFVESGHADMFTTGRGVNIALSFQHRNEFPYLSEPKAKCEIDSLDVRLGSDIKHTVVGPTIVSMFKGTLKSQLESAIEKALEGGTATLLTRVNRALGLIAPSSYGLLAPPSREQQRQYGIALKESEEGGYGAAAAQYRPGKGAWWLAPSTGRTKDEEADAVRSAYLKGEDAFTAGPSRYAYTPPPSRGYEPERYERYEPYEQYGADRERGPGPRYGGYPPVAPEQEGKWGSRPAPKDEPQSRRWAKGAGWGWERDKETDRFPHGYQQEEPQPYGKYFEGTRRGAREWEQQRGPAGDYLEQARARYF